MRRNEPDTVTKRPASRRRIHSPSTATIDTAGGLARQTADRDLPIVSGVDQLSDSRCARVEKFDVGGGRNVNLTGRL